MDLGKADIVPYVHRMIAILFTVPILIYLHFFSFCEHNTSGFCFVAQKKWQKCNVSLGRKQYIGQI